MAVQTKTNLQSRSAEIERRKPCLNLEAVGHGGPICGVTSSAVQLFGLSKVVDWTGFTTDNSWLGFLEGCRFRTKSTSGPVIGNPATVVRSTAQRTEPDGSNLNGMQVIGLQDIGL